MRCVAGGVVACVLAGAVGGCTGTDHIEIANVERNLKAMAQEVSGLEVTASCPSNVRNEVGTPFRCRVTTHGRSYSVRGEVTEPTGEGFPWEFDEDDLHVGPATLTCAQMRQDAAWEGAAAQLLARESDVTQVAPGAAQLRAVAKLFMNECERAAPGLFPYPAVAGRIASP